MWAICGSGFEGLHISEELSFKSVGQNDASFWTRFLGVHWPWNRLPVITTEGNLNTQSEFANEEVNVVLREHDMIDTVFKVGF